MNLTYHETFFKFYEANRKDVDTILAARCHHYSYLMDAQELRSEIMMRLIDSDFLTKYDSNKAQLHTYLTYTINGAATHVLRTELLRPFWRREDGVRYNWTPVSVHELNLEDDDNRQFKQFGVEDSQVEEMETKDEIEYLHNGFSREEDKELVGYLCDGLNNVEIAAIKGVSHQAVRARMVKIVSRAKSLLTREYSCATKAPAPVKHTPSVPCVQKIVLTKDQVKTDLLAAVESYRNKNITWCKLAPHLVDAVDAGVEFPKFKSGEKGLNSTRFHLMITCYRYLKLHRPEALDRLPAPPLDNVGRVMNLSAKVSGEKFEKYLDQVATGNLSCRRMRAMIRELKESANV